MLFVRQKATCTELVVVFVIFNFSVLAKRILRHFAQIINYFLTFITIPKQLAQLQ
jgi:hypothetical protein